MGNPDEVTQDYIDKCFSIEPTFALFTNEGENMFSCTVFTNGVPSVEKFNGKDKMLLNKGDSMQVDLFDTEND